MSRLKIGAALCALLGLFLAVRGIMQASAAVRPKTETLSEFLATVPSPGYYNIPDVFLDLTQSRPLTSDGRPAKPGEPASYYVALHGPHDRPDDVVHIFVEINDPAITADIATIRKNVEHATLKEAVAYIQKNRDMVYRRDDITGMIETVPANALIHRSLSTVAQNVDPTFVLFAQGAKPTSTGGLYISGAGAILILLALMLLVVDRRSNTTRAVLITGPEPSNTLPPGGPAPAGEWSGLSGRPSGQIGSNSGRVTGSQGSYQRSGPITGSQGSYPRSGPITGQQGAYPRSGPVTGQPPRRQSSRQAADPGSVNPGDYLTVGPFAQDGAEQVRRPSAPLGPSGPQMLGGSPEPANPVPAADAPQTPAFPPAFDPFADTDLGAGDDAAKKKDQ